ncbi:probable 28S ribosomal protein S6, mitochondrial [Lutzomyia longipalpis]|uniref:probable 28S ribosomal protein S6, mitochondrial n=1 Tax=Lutzomyia longipalpis TaxID=7200 RepID=UPI00248399C1|nr:probable 28S ribosomal protein S6, mitochondrial [Lutzomyia longipalpis]
MPVYELFMILRQMPRPELVAGVKRAAEIILDRGGVIRTINNMGTLDLPYKMSSQEIVHRVGTYFTVEFSVPPTQIEDIDEEYSRDVDIIRRGFFKMESELDKPVVKKCTLHEELLPPAYRKEVQEMIAIANRRKKPKFQYNSGLDYYPFAK